jgi:hypothetical protein
MHGQAIYRNLLPDFLRPGDRHLVNQKVGARGMLDNVLVQARIARENDDIPMIDLEGDHAHTILFVDRTVVSNSSTATAIPAGGSFSSAIRIFMSAAYAR